MPIIEGKGLIILLMRIHWNINIEQYDFRKKKYILRYAKKIKMGKK